MIGKGLSNKIILPRLDSLCACPPIIVSLLTSDLEFPLDLRVLDSKWSSNYLSDGANSKKGKSPHDGGSKKIEHRTKETGADYSLGKDYKSEIDFDIDVGGYN